MCDTNSLEKTLSQYLISNSGSLILADADALPIVDKLCSGQPEYCSSDYLMYFYYLMRLDTHTKKGILCGSRELFGDFVAPEQLWHDGHKPFNASEQHAYDEKSDVYKIPAVCEYFIGDKLWRTEKLSRLRALLKRCLNYNPEQRPSAYFIKVSVKALIQDIIL